MTATPAGRGPSEPRKRTPFLQMLTIFLCQDFRFPIPEALFFVFTLSVFFFASLGSDTSEANVAFGYVSVVTVAPLLILMVLIWRNVSSGLGGDFEKGIMQTYLTYPLGRGRLYLARLVSSVGVTYALFAVSQFLAIVVVAPAFLARQAQTFLLAYAAAFGTPLLITALVLLTAVASKQAGLPLMMGVFSYLMVGLLVSLWVGIAQLYNNYVLLGALFILNPFTPLSEYFNGVGYNFGGVLIQPPTLAVAESFVFVNYVLTVALFVAGYVWFTRAVET